MRGAWELESERGKAEQGEVNLYKCAGSCLAPSAPHPEQGSARVVNPRGFPNSHSLILSLALSPGCHFLLKEGGNHLAHF